MSPPEQPTPYESLPELLTPTETMRELGIRGKQTEYLAGIHNLFLGAQRRLYDRESVSGIRQVLDATDAGPMRSIRNYGKSADAVAAAVESEMNLVDWVRQVEDEGRIYDTDLEAKTGVSPYTMQRRRSINKVPFVPDNRADTPAKLFYISTDDLRLFWSWRRPSPMAPAEGLGLDNPQPPHDLLTPKQSMELFGVDHNGFDDITPALPCLYLAPPEHLKSAQRRFPANAVQHAVGFTAISDWPITDFTHTPTAVRDATRAQQQLSDNIEALADDDGFVPLLRLAPLLNAGEVTLFRRSQQTTTKNVPVVRRPYQTTNRSTRPTYQIHIDNIGRLITWHVPGDNLSADYEP